MTSRMLIDRDLVAGTSQDRTGLQPTAYHPRVTRESSRLRWPSTRTHRLAGIGSTAIVVDVEPILDFAFVGHLPLHPTWDVRNKAADVERRKKTKVVNFNIGQAPVLDVLYCSTFSKPNMLFQHLWFRLPLLWFLAPLLWFHHPGGGIDAIYKKMLGFFTWMNWIAALQRFRSPKDGRRSGVVDLE